VNALAFDVALHVGTLIALVVAFWDDCVRYLRAAFSRPASIHETEERRLSWLIVLGIIPAGIAGFFFDGMVEEQLRSEYIVVAMLIIVALLFIAVEWKRKGKPGHALNSLLWQQALFIGLMQAVALVPGTSRSGITIVAGMMMQLRREDAARFSFLLAIPITAAAALKKVVDLATMGIGAHDAFLVLLGIVSAAVTGFIALRFLLQFVKTRTLIPFAIYRIALAVIVLMIVMY
jgi:undecaprenyl-diphosphatase